MAVKYYFKSHCIVKGRSVNVEEDFGMNYIIFCSECGYKLARAMPKSEIEMKCPKCGAQISYKITDDTITVRYIKNSEKLPKVGI